MGAPKQRGVLVSRVVPTSAAAKVVKAGDVLVAFDNEPIGNDGTVRFRKHERVMYTWLVAQKFFGEKAVLTVLRDGEKMDVPIESFHPEVPLVPIHLFEKKHPGPSYFIVGGLVLTSLSLPFLESEYGQEWDRKAPVEMVQWTTIDHAETEGEQIVMLTQVLSHPLTVGYETLENLRVDSVCGPKVKNLAHALELVEGVSGGYLRLGLQHSQVLVLKADEAKAATAEVLEKHSVPHAMSVDLRELREPLAR